MPYVDVMWSDWGLRGRAFVVAFCPCPSHTGECGNPVRIERMICDLCQHICEW